MNINLPFSSENKLTQKKQINIEHHEAEHVNPYENTNINMTKAGYSTAAGWLQQISGVDPQSGNMDRDDSKDPVLRDLRDMKDSETKEVPDLPPPRRSPRNLRNAAHNGVSHMQQQPKPKFVAHKNPTRGKKGKDKVVSNRLGGEHMA